MLTAGDPFLPSLFLSRGPRTAPDSPGTARSSPHRSGVQPAQPGCGALRSSGVAPRLGTLSESGTGESGCPASVATSCRCTLCRRISCPEGGTPGPPHRRACDPNLRQRRSSQHRSARRCCRRRTTPHDPPRPPPAPRRPWTAAWRRDRATPAPLGAFGGVAGKDQLGGETNRRTQSRLGLPQGYHFLMDRAARPSRGRPCARAYSSVPRRYSLARARIAPDLRTTENTRIQARTSL